MSSTDPFEWRRQAFGGTPQDPDLVRIQIRYSYPAPGGVFTGHWQDCCVTSIGNVVVATGPPLGVTRILALDDVGGTNLFEALKTGGIPECSNGPVPRCFEPYDPVGFTSPLVDLTRTKSGATDSGYYKVVVIASDISLSMRVALEGRKLDLIDFASDGGGIVMYGQSDTGAWSWLPDGSLIAAVAGTGDAITLTTKGKTHPSHLNSVDATLSNWAWSHINGFDSWPSYLGASTTSEALSTGTISGQTEAISLAGPYSSRGCVFISGQPVDLVASGPPSGGKLIDPREGAMMLLRASVEYALQC